MKNYINLGEINTDNTSGFSYEWYFNLTSDILNSNLFTFSFNLTDGNDFKGTDKILLTNIDELNVTRTINVSSIDVNKWYHLILTISDSGLANVYVNGLKKHFNLNFGNIKSGTRSHCYFGAGPNTINKYTSNEDPNYSEMKVRYVRMYNNKQITDDEAYNLYKLRNQINIFKPYQNDLIKGLTNQNNPDYSFDFRNISKESLYDYISKDIVMYNGDITSNEEEGAILLNNEYQIDFLSFKPEIALFDDTKTGKNKGSSFEFYIYISEPTILTRKYRYYMFSFTEQDENNNITKEFSFFNSNDGLGIEIKDTDTNILTYGNTNYSTLDKYYNKWVQIVLVYQKPVTDTRQSEIRVYITDEDEWNTNNTITEIGNYIGGTDLTQQILSNTYNRSFINSYNLNKLAPTDTLLLSNNMNIKYFRIWNNYSLSIDEIKELYKSKNDDKLYVYNESYTPSNNVEFKKALLLYYIDKDYSFKTFGKIKDWDTRNVTNMDYMVNILSGDYNNICRDDLLTNWGIDISDFYTSYEIDVPTNIDAFNFNEDISKWDTTNVTSMKYMFHDARLFNIDITKKTYKPYEDYTSTLFNINQEKIGWDISNVTNMESMFENAEKFNQRMHSSTINPTNTTNMFKNATNFINEYSNSYGFNNGEPTNDFFNKTNLNNITIKLAINEYLDSSSNAINKYGPINNWDLYNVTDMSNLFRNTSFNEDISSWRVSNVTNMSSTFDGASEFNQNINNWDTSNVILFSYCFKNATKFNQPLNNWNTSKTKYINSMFENCNLFNQNIKNWNVSNIENFNNMFKNASLMNSEPRNAPSTPTSTFFSL